MRKIRLWPAHVAAAPGPSYSTAVNKYQSWIGALLSCVMLLSTSFALADEATPPPVSPDERYNAAVTFFGEGEYEEVQRILGEILFPKPLIEGAEKIAKAHVLLAAAYLALGNEKSANRVVKEIIKIDVNFQFEKQYDPNLMKMAESHRIERKKELEVIAAQPETITVVPMTTTETILHLIPGGVGQFVDGRYVSGAVYLAIQAGLGGYMMYLEQEFRNDVVANDNMCALQTESTGVQPCIDKQRNKNIVSGVFVAALAIGVLDSFIFRPSVPTASVEPTVSFNIGADHDGASAALKLSF